MGFVNNRFFIGDLVFWSLSMMLIGNLKVNKIMSAKKRTISPSSPLFMVVKNYSMRRFCKYVHKNCWKYIHPLKMPLWPWFIFCSQKCPTTVSCFIKKKTFPKNYFSHIFCEFFNETKIDYKLLLQWQDLSYKHNFAFIKISNQNIETLHGNKNILILIQIITFSPSKFPQDWH